MKLRELLRGENIDREYCDTEVNAISRSEMSCKDAVLFCLVGRSFDKAAFTSLAIKGGARFIVADTDLEDSEIPVIKVKNTRRSYAFAVAAFCGDPQKEITFYGITGTNGKTSTSYFLHSILNYCGIINALIGTNGVLFNKEKIPFPPENSGIAQMTTPDPEFLYPLLKHLLTLGIKNVVMEVSSHALALFKVDPIRFKASIFTNFSHEHLDFHRSTDEYLKAKLRLCELSDRILYNANDITLARVFEKRNAISFGIEKGSYTACCVRHKGVDGVSYFLKHHNSVFRIESRICGTFTVANSLAALSLALEEGLPIEVLCDAVLSIPFIPGRLERLLIDKTRYPFSVMIDYAHTPRSFEELLSSDIFKARKARLITLFGCGGERDTEKRALMGKIAEKYSDKIYITNDNPRGEDPEKIISDILQGIKEICKTVVLPDRKEAITAAFSELKKDDILLLVGKGNENYLVDKEGRRSFSEREIVYALADVNRKEK
ncbi:MAG: UDP-N-acetylmuramoyl-L-alanyl-D-glutamate--2,6-diaminopimelate ligase [Clostridia bacterium]|nr:UDP-N-acetylmuramoyl-L-alanyl-D-glutamate--2,6-diaminopimelate ligase [Clostridia bacterium]